MKPTLLAVFSSVLALSLFGQSAQAAESPPNIVVVLCDDLGYADVGCFGNPDVKTPNIDRFAAQGLKLTDCYAAAPNCSPARTGLMTGRTPYRVGVYNWIPFLSPIHVSSQETTVATKLKQAGYDTCHSGKWHMNGWFNLPGQPQPGDHGFQHWFSTQNNALPNHHNPYNFVRNGIPCGPREGYAAQLVADEAIRWLTDLRDKTKPFFLYVCFHEPHEPIATDPEFAALYDSNEPSYRAHHGNISQMDAAFGRLIDTIDQQGLGENTVIFFTSDNGPAMTRRHPWGSTGPYKLHKGHLYEGGIRVPGIVRWTGTIKPGQTSAEPVSGVDFMPTLCSLAGTAPPDDRHLDGTDLTPLLKGQPLNRKQPLYWQFNYAKSAPRVALRDGDWKLLATLNPQDQGNLTAITDEQMRQLKSAKLDRFELYNLKDDIGETRDLSDSHPEKLKELKAEMQKVYSSVQDEGPVWPAWDWPREEGQRIEWPDYPIPDLPKKK